MPSTRIDIQTEPAYSVHIQPGLLEDDSFPDLLKKIHPPTEVRLVADKSILTSIGHHFVRALEKAGYIITVDQIVSGEKSKSVKTWQKLMERWAAARFNRHDLVLSLGGGTIGDLAGFSAATYMRGVPFVQVPTTLLSAIDASVGGKTALNLKTGKNLVGVFTQPKAVFCDPMLFSSLPSIEWQNGLAELIKIAWVADPLLFERLKDHPLQPTDEDLTEVLAAAIRAKAGLVTADVRDNGPRQYLNFGHSLGHAIETISDFQIPHGQAVAMGMGEAVRLAYDHQYCNQDTCDALLNALTTAGLPNTSPFALYELAPVMLLDKKADDQHVTLILPEALGQMQRVEIPKKDLSGFLTRGKNDGLPFIP